MNKQEAIEILKCGEVSIYYDDHEEALNIAIECIEKQIPKKPEFDVLLTFNDDEVPVPYCPVCAYTIYEEDNFCSNCGQAILWESDNE